MSLTLQEINRAADHTRWLCEKGMTESAATSAKVAKSSMSDSEYAAYVARLGPQWKPA